MYLMEFFAFDDFVIFCMSWQRAGGALWTNDVRTEVFVTCGSQAIVSLGTSSSRR
jgi:hypothetical protein